MRRIRVFDFVSELDAFRVTAEYQRLADELGLSEWNPVVWIGRLFTLDNDFGEHWFDNWDERAALADRARGLGIAVDEEELMVVVPERFEDGRDGPCHPPGIRKRFWTDVLAALELSLELLFEEARRINELERMLPPEDAEPIDDLEERIAQVRSRYA